MASRLPEQCHPGSYYSLQHPLLLRAWGCGESEGKTENTHIITRREENQSSHMGCCEGVNESGWAILSTLNHDRSRAACCRCL